MDITLTFTVPDAAAETIINAYARSRGWKAQLEQIENGVAQAPIDNPETATAFAKRMIGADVRAAVVTQLTQDAQNAARDKVEASVGALLEKATVK